MTPSLHHLPCIYENLILQEPLEGIQSPPEQELKSPQVAREVPGSREVPGAGVGRRRVPDPLPPPPGLLAMQHEAFFTGWSYTQREFIL